jgi:hypothetical protein
MKIVSIAILFVVVCTSRILGQVDPYADDAIQRMRTEHVSAFAVKSYPYPDSVVPTYIENSVILQTHTGFQMKTTTISEGKPVDTTIRDYNTKGQLRALAKRSLVQHSLSRWRYNEFDSVSEFIASTQLTRDTAAGSESRQLNTFAKVGKSHIVRRILTQFFDNGKEVSSERYVYDSLGHLDSVQRFSGETKLKGESRPESLILFSYNKSVLTQRVQLRFMPDSVVDTSMEKYFYDSSGRKAYTLYYRGVPSHGSKQSTEMNRELNGRILLPGTHTHGVPRPGVLPSQQEPRSVSATRPKPPQLVVQLTSKDSLDSLGRLVEKDQLSFDAKVLSRQRFIYKNDKLIRTEQVSFMPDGTEGGTDRTLYTYDAMGNLIKSEDSHNGQLAFTHSISYTFSKQ